jgi:hypothetical protein
MSRWSAEQVLALAPDSASATAGRRLAATRGWPVLGSDERAVWGLAQGSGKNPYQVAVDLDGPAFRCSCPSRKVPCKHAIGLLLLWSAGDAKACAPPPFAEEWLAARAERADKAVARSAARSAKEVDPEARAKRQAQREDRISAGVEELDRWLNDLVRQGLAAAQSRPMRFWDDAAARLVDAQAPALGGRVRAFGSAAHSGRADWPARLLSQIARVHLAVSAWPRAGEMPEGLRSTLREVLGWPLPGEEVRRDGERVDDAWVVLGVRTIEQERLRVRRTWLRGERSGRPALIAQFTTPGGSFDGDYVVGSVLEGALAYYPAAAALRALPVSDLARRATGTSSPLGGDDLGAALGEWARALAADPWLERWPVALRAVAPIRTDGRWWLRDEDGAMAPLADGAPWRLVALAGGAPLQVSGEWDGRALHPLAAFTGDDRVVALA